MLLCTFVVIQVQMFFNLRIKFIIHRDEDNDAVTQDPTRQRYLIADFIIPMFIKTRGAAVVAAQRPPNLNDICWSWVRI